MQETVASTVPFAIETIDLKKTYSMGLVKVPALQGVSLKVKHGEMISIVGPSGSGEIHVAEPAGCPGYANERQDPH